MRRTLLAALLLGLACVASAFDPRVCFPGATLPLAGCSPLSPSLFPGLPAALPLLLL